MSEAQATDAVREVMTEGRNVDRQARIAELEKRLARVKGDIDGCQRIERRCELVNSAYEKLRQELGKTLTREEYAAIDGIYLFLHSGCVDIVHSVPSATSRGEDKKLDEDLATGKALKELEALTKEAK